MKHYLQPLGAGDGTDGHAAWEQIPVLAPLEGRIDALVTEATGRQVWLRPDAAPAFRVGLFHLAPLPGLAPGDPVWPGQLLGHPAGHDTYVDLVLEWSTPEGGRRLLSYFQALDPALWPDFTAQGVSAPADLVIPRAERDAAPLRCRGEAFEAAAAVSAAVSTTVPTTGDAAASPPAPAAPADWQNLTPAPVADAAAVAAALAPRLRLELLAEDLPYPVALAWGPAPAGSGREGEPVLYVATNGEAFPGPGSREGAVWWLEPAAGAGAPDPADEADDSDEAGDPDEPGKGAATALSPAEGTPPPTARARPFLTGLDRPLGLLWTGMGPGAELLVSSRGRLAAWRDGDGDGQAEAERLLAAGLPADGLHQNNSLALGPGGLVYLGLGTAGNAAESAEDPLAGSILRLPSSGEGPPVVHASGLRNPFDLAFGADGRLWATDNGVDPPVREDAPDELNQVVAGGFYGHPQVFGAEAPDELSRRLDPRPPAALFEAHASADGLLAYRGRRFPELRGLLLVAEFGSYLYSSRQSGRRLSLVAPGPAGRESAATVAPLLDPFPGRPLDLVEGPDGRIQVADFEGGRVWVVERAGTHASR